MFKRSVPKVLLHSKWNYLGMGAILLILAFFNSFGLDSPVYGQTATGSISGYVTDQNNAAIPDASIQVTNLETQITTGAKTGAGGLYVFPSLQPGSYEVKVSREGFRDTVIPRLTLGVQDNISRDVVLMIGSATQTVTVNADPAATLVQSTSSELGTVIGEKDIQDLPLNGRNFTELLSLTPGAIPVSTSQSAGIGVNDLANLAPPSAQIAQPTIGGQFNRSNLYMLDGAVNTELTTSAYIIPPIADSMQEFKVQSHEDKAEYGGVLGGVVDVVTRGGTNRLHASAWEFVRNNDFDARDSFADEAGGAALPPSPYHQNQFGVLVSGPVWLPKLYDGHNRTFFLFSYEGWRFDQAAQSKYWVPTSAELGGDFSHSILNQPIYDPATTRPDPNNPGQYIRDPFPGNIIPSGRMDQTSVNFIKAYFNQPNLSGDPLGNLLVKKPSINNSGHYMGRLDEQLGGKDSFFFRYDLLNVVSLTANSNTQDTGGSVPATNFAIGWTHAFSSTLLLDNKYGQTTRPFARFLSDTAGLAPMTGLGFTSAGGTTLALSGPWTSGGINLANNIASPVNDLSDSVTWVHREHNFKFGMQYIKQGNDGNSPPYGAFTFTNDTTGNPESVGTTGNSLASAFLGLPSVANNTQAQPSGNRVSSWAGFGQDTWNISKSVTLTYGFRVDHRRPFAPDSNTFISGPNVDGKYWVGLNQMPGQCGATGPIPCIPGGFSSVPDNNEIVLSPYGRAWSASYWTDFGPRIGLAWRPSNRMVVRGGYGIVYDDLTGMEQDWKGIQGSWPAVGSVDNSVSLNQLGQPLSPIENNVATVGVQLPAASPWGQSNWYFDPHHRDGRSQQWNVEIEREMTKNMALSIGYVGSKTDRLDATGLWDTAETPGPGTPDQVQALKPFPWYQQTSFYGTDRGFSHYNSLQAKLNRHFENGLQYLVSYTWSKTTDAGGSGWFDVENGNGGSSELQNYYDINSSRGLSALDIPQDLAISGMYELPFGKGKPYLKNGIASLILGNWQTNAVIQMRSGQPYNMTVPGDVANIGNTVSWWNYARPNLVGKAKPAHSSRYEWFNPSAFAVPSFSYGNSPKNFLRSPHVSDADFSIFKSFPIRESASLTFRAEAFNIFNIQNYGVPDSNYGDPTFGQITSNVQPPRELELALHLQY
jgi:Carboxypeptidase regulatory-like domain